MRRYEDNLLLEFQKEHRSAGAGKLMAPGFFEHEVCEGYIVTGDDELDADEQSRIFEAIKKIGEGNFAGFDALTESGRSPVSLARFMKAHKKNISDLVKQEDVRKICLQVLHETYAIDEAKYALLLLPFVPEDEELKEVVLTYDQDEEFTYYTTQVIASWPDGNDLLMDLIEKTKGGYNVFYAIGWRVHAFHPITEKMKQWLLLECPIYRETVCDVFEKAGVEDTLLQRPHDENQ
jgi:hypothetical protein